jgi:hypothetical protein
VVRRVVLGAGSLESWLGLPVVLMREAGLVLVPKVIFVVFLAPRPAHVEWFKSTLATDFTGPSHYRP